MLTGLIPPLGLKGVFSGFFLGYLFRRSLAFGNQLAPEEYADYEMLIVVGPPFPDYFVGRGEADSFLSLFLEKRFWVLIKLPRDD